MFCWNQVSLALKVVGQFWFLVRLGGSEMKPCLHNVVTGLYCVVWQMLLKFYMGGDSHICILLFPFLSNLSDAWGMLLIVRCNPSHCCKRYKHVGIMLLQQVPALWYGHFGFQTSSYINPLKPELNPICYLLALLGARHFLHVSRIRVKLLTFRRLTSYIYGAPILDVSRSHTTTQHSR